MGEGEKKNLHFKGTFQISSNEVEKLQIYIDKKSVGFFLKF